MGGGGACLNVPCTSYIIVCYAAEISGIVATLLVTALQRSLVLLLLRDMILRCWWGGVGWGGGACQRSLYFVHYSLLRCRDLWDADCQLKTVHALRAMTVKRQKTRLRFCKVFNIRNQFGTVVKSPFLDKMCTPMSTVSGPAGCLCEALRCFEMVLHCWLHGSFVKRLSFWLLFLKQIRLASLVSEVWTVTKCN